MKKLSFFILILCCFSAGFVQSQSTTGQLPEMELDPAVIESHLRFLASDELQGRRTTDPGNNVAARYIAEEFRSYGLKSPEGADDYFQFIPFENKIPPKEGFIRWGEHVYEHGNDMLIMAGDSINTKAEVVFANFGWIDSIKGIDDYEGLDVKGKIVVAISGLADTQDPGAVFGAMRTKRKIAASKGAVALIELYRLSFPWQFFKNYFGKARLDIADDKDTEGPGLPYIWMTEHDKEASLQLKEKSETSFQIKTTAFQTEPKPSQNVIGVLEGTDPVLKNEYIICTAHYDHVGTGKNGGGAFTAKDSIFNGARDNAMGVVALLSAAKALSQKPPKRSVVFMALTGEEMGLLGSSYYVENPLIPLKQTVFNLNSDGAGYDDTSAYSVIGYDRVGTKEEFDQAAAQFGFKIIADPAPEQNLFDRSDNVNFAAKGIPAPTVSGGTTGFSPEIQKYYHQAIDNPETIDYVYLAKFCKTYAHLARLIANKNEAPKWKAGDKYEQAAKALYGN